MSVNSENKHYRLFLFLFMTLCVVIAGLIPSPYWDAYMGVAMGYVGGAGQALFLHWRYTTHD